MAKSFINNSQSVAALAVDSLKLNGKDASLYALKSEISGGGASEIITLTQEEFDALTQDDIAGYYTNGVRTILVKSTGNDNEPVYMRLDIAMNLTDEQKEAAVQSLGLDERYSPKIKKVFHQFSVPVAADTHYDTQIPYSTLGIDTNKVLFCEVCWSNSADDVPVYCTKYIGTDNNVLYLIGHRWDVTQTVNFKINVIYMESETV